MYACINSKHVFEICKPYISYVARYNSIAYTHINMPWWVLNTAAWKGKLQQSALRKEVSAEAKLKAELKKDYLQAKAWLKSQLNRNYDLDHRDSSDLDNSWLLPCIKPQKAS